MQLVGGGVTCPPLLAVGKEIRLWERSSQMATLRTSVEHLIHNIDEFVLARVRRYRGKSTSTFASINAHWTGSTTTKTLTAPTPTGVCRTSCASGKRCGYAP